MDYNTTRNKLRLPEYGRLVQEMVEKAKAINDLSQRQAYATIILRIMRTLNPHQKHTANYEQKLWEHLAYIANYELDIEYPVEISKKGVVPEPKSVAYPKSYTKLRHYGSLTERWLQKIVQMPVGNERELLTKSIANYMKRSLVEKKGMYTTDEKVAHDIAEYTEGAMTLDTSKIKLIHLMPKATKKHK